jgi:hypothetical protein
LWGVIAIVTLSSVVTLSYAFIQPEKDKQVSGFTKAAEDPIILAKGTRIQEFVQKAFKDSRKIPMST